MHERDKERGERDYVKGNQLCFCLKRWKTITVKRIVFIKFQLIKGWKLWFISSKIWVYGCTCMKNRMIELGNITHIKDIFGKKKITSIELKKQVWKITHLFVNVYKLYRTPVNFLIINQEALNDVLFKWQNTKSINSHLLRFSFAEVSFGVFFQYVLEALNT